ncbi:MAG: efflux RND transporter permease subunit, partial [Thioalkalivibrio sp.]|nr:efflux RND transporter permease subunit [Thioalkalivibrio sp.]
AGTLVTAAGFIPIGFAQSRVGEYAGNIFWILAFTLMTSWVVAVAFTPYLGVKLLPKIQPHPGGADELYNTPNYRRLRRLVTWCVDHRLVVGGITTLLMVAAIAGMRFGVEQQFFPTSDRPELQVDVQLPQGSAIAATRAITARVEDFLRQAQESEHVATYIGRGSPRFFLALDPELPDPAFAKLIVRTGGKEARQSLQNKVEARVAEGAFADARVRAHPLLYGPPVPWPVTFRVMGPDVDALRGIAEQVRRRIAEHPHTTQAHAEWGERVSALRLSWDRQRLRLLGLTPREVAEQVQAATDGVRATEIREDIRTVDLVTRVDPATRPDLASLGSLVIETGTGERLPLEQVAALEVIQEAPVLKRRNRTPVLEVHAEVHGGVQPATVTAEIDPTLDTIRAELPRGYRVDVGGSVEESGKARASIANMLPVMVAVMVTLIMLSMRSFPGTIMTLLTAPLGLIGAVAGLLLTDRPFGFVAMLGLIGLAGILMRNTLILAGQIQANQSAGMDDYTAVIEATLRRARPVVLTALAAVLAFLPLTTSTFWGPLAVVLIGGVTVGTVLTLLFLPALYALWFRVHPPAG